MGTGSGGSDNVWKQPVLVIRLAWPFEISWYLMVRTVRRDAANGVFNAGEGSEAGFAGMLCMRRFGEGGQRLAWAVHADG